MNRTADLLTLSPTPPTALLGSSAEQVSDGLLSRYADLIYARTGIRVSPQKKALLSNRLRRRLRSTGIAGFDKYYDHLKALSPRDPEWDAFLQEITTHETYLFRDMAQWDWLRSVFLPSLAASPRPGVLRIWSAACSTGDEAFTAACCVAAALPEHGKWKVQIVGSDIGIGAVEQARTGTFGDRAMRLVSESYRRCYFAKARDAQVWQAKPALADMTSFKQHNLLEPISEKPFHLVFLKNVLIYFDRPSKKRVMANVERAIVPGGYLIAGAAEGVSDLVGDLTRIEPWLYQRKGIY